MNTPAKEKYIDEAFKMLFEFGGDTMGNTCVQSEDSAIEVYLTAEKAAKVLAANRKYFQELYKILGYAD